MSRGRPARRVRFKPNANLVNFVIGRATRLTQVELEQIMLPIRQAMTALREGVATELQWITLASSVEVALSIEGKGVVRGLRGHFEQAEQALAGIFKRAMESGQWVATPLYYQELDHVGEAVFLHEFQLEQVSTAELAGATKAAITRVHQAGGRVLASPVREEATA